MMTRCDLHEVDVDRRGCPWCQVEQLEERVEQWKTWHDSASEDAKKWRRDAQHLFGIMQNDILSAMDDCIELGMTTEQMRGVVSHIIKKALAKKDNP